MNPADHLIIAPILVPLVVGALILFFDERRRVLKASFSLASTVILLAVTVFLMVVADGEDVGVYRLGDWPAPFAIVLVLDRLSALMLVLGSVLALPALVFSLARWHKVGAHFHSLFQFLLVGLNGAFLTGDLFNLFVFFEVMLAASYGLVLHGSGPLRVRAGLHYVAVNLVAAALFLIGVSLIYGVTGTLNMADLATRIPAVADEDRMLLEAGAAILGIAFLVKAAMWPLSFWLPTAYSVAAAPVAAVFALLSKVGVYVLLRLSLLFFGDGTGGSAGFGADVLLFGGIATIAFGSIGVLASQSMGRLAGYSVLVSSGTLLAALGIGSVSITAGLLFYLVASTIALSGFFLLIELIERGQDPSAEVLAVTKEAFGEGEVPEVDEAGVVAIPLPATLAVLGVGFALSAVLIAGLPPLSGFVGKLALLTALFDTGGGAVSGMAWTLALLLILSGLSALIAMTRAGIRIFWAPVEESVPHVAVVEVAPVAALFVISAALAIYGGPAMAYMEATARSLHQPAAYVASVLSPPADAAAEGGVTP
jgi:multicomponent K+:H+ antiporter subunit D